MLIGDILWRTDGSTRVPTNWVRGSVRDITLNGLGSARPARCPGATHFIISGKFLGGEMEGTRVGARTRFRSHDEATLPV